MGCKLFKDMCKEIPDLKAKCEEHIINAAKTMVELEEKYIDKMFELGDIENLKSYDLKQFIRKRANEKLIELGYLEIFHYDKKAADNLNWFYHLTGGHTHTDFFAIRPTDYSKANEGENFEDIW
jgi:ribonucleoside-diphosphate reductase beta chain